MTMKSQQQNLTYSDALSAKSVKHIVYIPIVDIFPLNYTPLMQNEQIKTKCMSTLQSNQASGIARDCLSYIIRDISLTYFVAQFQA